MLHIEENKLISPMTTLGIGGEARFFVRATSEDQVAESVELAAKKDLSLFVLGGGSNVLVSDSGFDGLVLQIGLRDGENLKSQISDFEFGNPSEPETSSAKLVTVGAGEDWDRFVELCVEGKLAGIECLSGIPGSVGGTPVQNVGAYGQEVAETIVSVRCLDRSSGAIVTLSNADCRFTYRTSILNSTHRERFIVLAVTFRLVVDGPPTIAYPELGRAVQTPASLGAVRDAVLRLRRKKSMVIDPADPNSRSAGSFFKNPIVACEKLTQIQSEYSDVPFFEFGQEVKIPAAWLIEKAGIGRGFALGEAGISKNHTLAFINRGSATAAEMVRLKEWIQAAVAAKFEIDLVPEPVFVGF